MRTIIDTHAHLYELFDASAVLRDCAIAGVSDVVALGVDLASNQKHLAIRPMSNDLKIHLAFGLHPGNITSAADTDACFAFMRENVKEAVAIGETGLDFWYKWVRKDEEKKREQREVFDRHLALAKEFGLPVVIHSRGAWRECLEQTVRSGVRKAEFHWYSGPADVLKSVLDAGFLVSFTPALAYSPEHRKAAELAPLERIMVETDTPVAYPKECFDTRHSTLDTRIMTDNSRKRVSDVSSSSVKCQVSSVPRVPSVPKDAWRTLKLLSELKGVPEDELLQTVNANAKRFFDI